MATKDHLELHAVQHEILRNSGSRELIFMPEELTDVQDKMSYIQEQMKKLRQTKLAIKSDISALREKMRQGEGCYDAHFDDKLEKEVEFWNVVIELQDQVLMDL